MNLQPIVCLDWLSNKRREYRCPSLPLSIEAVAAELLCMDVLCSEPLAHRSCVLCLSMCPVHKWF